MVLNFFFLEELKTNALSSTNGEENNGDAKKIERAISQKQEAEAKLISTENKLKHLEEAFNEL